MLCGIHVVLLLLVLMTRPHVTTFLNATGAAAALNRVGAIAGTALTQSTDAGLRDVGATVAMVFASSAILLQVLQAVKAVADPLIAKCRGEESGVAPGDLAEFM